MIISASYRTDIPALYADWFLRRLAAGWCRAANPFGRGDYEVSLAPAAVDGVVLWTRNLRAAGGNRPGCRRALSRDIGAYDSCPHGGVYCYAFAHRDRASANYRRHDPAAEKLCG